MKSELMSPPPREILLYPRGSREKTPFHSTECEFIPCGWTKIGDEFFPLAYKVVDENLKSLGLRNNPNIMTFSVGQWVKLPDEEVTIGNTHWSGWGGIWTALQKGSIKTLESYCLEMYQMKTRAFLTAMYRPLYANSYRIKSQGVMLLEEIT
jgi:hypothetical protein